MRKIIGKPYAGNRMYGLKGGMGKPDRTADRRP